MSLTEYQRKRDFRKTPEPVGKKAPSRGELAFVVQKHAASRLHYDFRLELDGALKSWAVPKGPSLDPGVKSLAVQVEDHPLAYAEFEGVIPQGEYGGGTVMVWDYGTWAPEGEDDPLSAWQNGKLKFTLAGEKLKGSWALVRMGGRAGEGGKNWLLMKHQDRAARSAKEYDVLTEEPRSAVSRRTIEQIAAAANPLKSSATKKQNSKRASATASATRNPAKDRAAVRPAGRQAAATRRSPAAASIAKIAGAKRSPLPREMKPQLATLVDTAPEGDAWLHELKFDGYRMLARLQRGKVVLLTRNGHDWTHRFQGIAEALAKLPLESGVIDGEIVALNRQGISDFQQLQNQLRRGDEKTLCFYAFDLPFARGYDLRRAALADRKQVLADILAASQEDAVRYSDHLVGSGGEFARQACQQALEGIICKQADSPYVGARSSAWVKVKCTRRQEFVIGGYTRPQGGRRGFGALLLGIYDGKKLVYAGRVGTGFTQRSLRDIHGELVKRKRKTSPFVSLPKGTDERGVIWLTPELIAEVAFTEWTDEGLLRHPSFQGLREDKAPHSIVREEPAMAEANGLKTKRSTRQRGSAAKPQRRENDGGVAGVTITHPDRVVFPETGLTKLALARYYEDVGKWIMPHVAGRPLSVVRCPDGAGGKCFYQKHLTDSMPAAVQGVEIKEKDDVEPYLVVNDLAGLISLVQFGALEFHPWPARADNVERPDRLIFDLDPAADVAWGEVIRAARDVRDLLEALGLTSFVRTTGGKGLHVVAPIARRTAWEQHKEFARGVAETLVRAAPERYTATMTKSRRKGKIFVDYLRNQRGATAIASYATRARAGAPVATPLQWNELTALASSDRYMVANLPERLRRLRTDPWEGFFQLRQSITAKALSKLAR
jgi:bifunctional non-homologous end joining protein LigD